jgi:hypothetical protein
VRCYPDESLSTAQRADITARLREDFVVSERDGMPEIGFSTSEAMDLAVTHGMIVRRGDPKSGLYDFICPPKDHEVTRPYMRPRLHSPGLALPVAVDDAAFLYSQQWEQLLDERSTPENKRVGTCLEFHEGGLHVRVRRCKSELYDVPWIIEDAIPSPHKPADPGLLHAGVVLVRTDRMRRD